MHTQLNFTISLDQVIVLMYLICFEVLSHVFTSWLPSEVTKLSLHICKKIINHCHLPHANLHSGITSRRPATRGGKSGNCPPLKFSKTYVFVRYSNKFTSFWPRPRKDQLVAALMSCFTVFYDFLVKKNYFLEHTDCQKLFLTLFWKSISVVTCTFNWNFTLDIKMTEIMVRFLYVACVMLNAYQSTHRQSWL